MSTNNKNSTRYYSDMHEKSVCKALNARQQPNSGATAFSAGDVVVDRASMLVECKTSVTQKDSISVKKVWIDKNKQEAFAVRKQNCCICINFGPNSENYYIIDEQLMKFLVEKLEEDYK